MLIQCTSCGTQANIPSSKEGAKVKCPSCGHVYVARPAGARGRAAKKEDPTKYVIIGGAVLAAVVLGVIASRSGGEEPVQAAPKEEVVEKQAPKEDLRSWDGTLIKLARELHAAGGAGNKGRLMSTLDAEAAYAFLPKAPKVPVRPDPKAPATEDEAPEPRTPWTSLSELDRINFADEMAGLATLRGEEGAVATWKPYDGEVAYLDELSGEATLIIRCQCSDASLDLPVRATEWRLRGDVVDGRVKTWKWIWVGRWYSDIERDKLSRPLRIRAEKKTLTDGSVVYESRIRPIEYDSAVTAEERNRITALVDDLADPELTGRGLSKVRGQVLEAGKTAVPALLTKMALIVTEGGSTSEFTPDDGAALQLIHESLRDITGYETTFEANVALGATRERIESGVKQWFAWYDRKYKRFDGPEQPDAVDADAILLEDSEIRPQGENEKRLFEEARQRKEQRDRNN